MCGRFTNKLSWTELLAIYRIVLGMDVPSWTGGVNIPPTAMIPVVRLMDGKRCMDLMRWGLIPSWAADTGAFSTFNARADTLTEKPAFRDAWSAGRRCLIPVESFFEWRKRDKQPFAIALGNREPMAFAGLWEEWKPEDGPPLLSCTIITTEANALMAPLHDRMPVIVGDEDQAAWLGETAASGEQLSALLKPFAPARMMLWPVSKAVGSVKNTSADLLAEVQPEDVEPAQPRLL